MEHIIWNREMECADRSTIKALQEERLRALFAAVVAPPEEKCT